MTLSAHMIAAYDNLSDQELRDRMAHFERKAAELKEKLARGDRGHVTSIHMDRGRWRNSYSNEAGISRLRSAWRDCRDVLRHREAQAARELIDRVYRIAGTAD